MLDMVVVVLLCLSGPTGAVSMEFGTDEMHRARPVPFLQVGQRICVARADDDLVVNSDYDRSWQDEQ